jgi:hypothetical protein
MTIMATPVQYFHFAVLVFGPLKRRYWRFILHFKTETYRLHSDDKYLNTYSSSSIEFLIGAGEQYILGTTDIQGHAWVILDLCGALLGQHIIIW